MNIILFDAFKIADAGRFIAKEEFNRLKKIILMAEGMPDGYSILNKPKICTKCKGKGCIETGKKKLGRKQISIIEKCPQCNGKHYYGTTQWYMLRFWLNGDLFHLYSYTEPKESKLYQIFNKEIEQPVQCITQCYESLALLLLYYDAPRIEWLNKNNPYMPLFKALEKQAAKFDVILRGIREEEKIAVNQ